MELHSFGDELSTEGTLFGSALRLAIMCFLFRLLVEAYHIVSAFVSLSFAE